MRRASFNCSLEGGMVSIFSSGVDVGWKDDLEAVVVLGLLLLLLRNTKGRDREESVMESAIPTPTSLPSTPTTGVSNDV